MVAAICCALGGAGCLYGLFLILSSVSGPAEFDPHGYIRIFGVLVMILSGPFLLAGLLVLLPPVMAKWLSRVTLVIVLVFLGLLLILLW